MGAAPGTAPLSGGLSSLMPESSGQLTHQGIWCNLLEELWVLLLGLRSGTPLYSTPKPVF